MNANVFEVIKKHQENAIGCSYLKFEDKVASSFWYFMAMDLIHSALIMQPFSEEAQDWLKLVPVHGISNQHQPFAS